MAGKRRYLNVAILVCAALGAAPFSYAEVCAAPSSVAEACVTGFDLRRQAPAAGYLLPLTCQYNLTREINAALVRKGYDFSRDRPLNDYQLPPSAVAAIHCEQKKAGLEATKILDRATVRLILGRDLLAERCRLAGYDQNCPILAEGGGL